VKLGNTDEFSFLNIPEDFFCEGSISFSGTKPLLSPGDEVRFYLQEDSSEHFVCTAEDVWVEGDDTVFAPSAVKYISHNEAEMLKLGRGRIF